MIVSSDPRSGRCVVGAVLALWIALGLTPQSTAARQEAAGTALSVRGALVDAAGKPRPGLRAVLAPQPSSYAVVDAALNARTVAVNSSQEVRTSSTDGKIAFAAPAPGFYSLRVKAGDGVTLEHRLWPLLADHELPPIVVPQVERLTVRVLGGQGHPLPGALLQLTAAEPRSMAPDTPTRPVTVAQRYARSGDDGVAVFGRIKSLNYRVTGAAPGMAPRLVEVGAETSRVDLQLAAGAAQRIQVVDAAGNAVADAIVLQGELAIPIARTDERGLATLWSDGKAQQVWAVRPSSESGVAELPPLGAQAVPGRPVRVRIASRRLSGRVVDRQSGRTVEGALLWDCREPTAFVRSEAGGTFTLPVPPAGGRTVHLHANAPGYAPWVSERVPTAEDAGLEIALEPVGGLEGRVIGADDAPIEGAHLRVRARELETFRTLADRRTSSDNEGRFALRALPAGYALDLDVRLEGYLRHEAMLSPLAPGATRALTVALERAPLLEARVVRPNGRPVEGAVALAGSVQEAGRFIAEPYTAYRSDAEGRLAIPIDRGGVWALHIRSAGWAHRVVRPIEVGGSAEEHPRATDLGELVMEPGEILEGRVIDPEGLPIEGARVAPFWIDGPLFWSGDQTGEVTTDARGRFEIAELRAGERASLSVERTGFRRKAVDSLEVPADGSIAVVLEPAFGLRGVVVRNDATPIPGASVFGGSGPPVETDAAGRFELDGLARGGVTLLVTLPDGGTISHDVTLPTSEGVRVVVDRLRALAGHVLRADRTPLTGVEVRAIQLPSDAFAAAARTDASGAFALANLAPGRYALAVHYPGLLPGRDEIVVPEGEGLLPEVELVLEEGARVRGIVVDGDGVGVAAARVDAPGTEAITDAQGRFELRGLATGQQRLSVRKDGYADGYASVVVDGVQEAEVEVALARAVVVDLRILGLDVEDGGRLTVLAMRGATRSESPIELGGGRFRFERLDPGRWTFRVVRFPSVPSTPGIGLSATRAFEIEPGQPHVELTLDLADGLVVRGRVLDASGQPIVGAQVRVGSSAFSRQDVTDARGMFRVRGLRSGAAWVSVDGAPLRSIEVGVDQDVTLRLPENKILGRVLDAGSGVPLEEVSVRAWGTGGAWSTTRTDAEGVFELMPCEDCGVLVLGLAAPGYRPERVELSPARLAMDAPLEIALQEGKPSSGLRLRLLPAPGAPLPSPHGSVEVVEAEDPMGPWRFLFTSTPHFDASGEALLEDLPQGHLRIVVEAPNVPVEVDVPGTGEAVLPLRGDLSLEVPELGPGSVARVRLRNNQGLPLVTLRSGQDLLVDGYQLLTDVPVGSWTIEVEASGGRRWLGQAFVNAAETVEVVLD